MMLLAILEAFGRSSAIGTDFELKICLFDFTLKLFFWLKFEALTKMRVLATD